MKKLFVVFVALAMVFGFTATAMADVTLHGSARFFTYSIDDDSDWTGTGYDDRDTQWQMGSLSRFGAKFSSGDVGGMWEMDARNTAGSDTSGLAGSNRMRHLYGYWNFGGGQLLIGQTWPVSNVFTSHLNMTTNGLQFWGGLGSQSARTTQIRLTFGNFIVAFATPFGGGTVAPYATDTDTTLPKVELRYDLKLEPVNIAFIGGWQEYDMVNATDQEVTCTSYTLAVAPQFKFGAAYLNLVLSYNQNPGNYGLSPAQSLTYSKAYMNAGNTDLEDMTGFSTAVAIGFKVSDMVTLEAGYGMSDYSGDVAGGDREDTTQAYYAQCKLTMAPGVYIVPEFAIFDADDSNAGGAGTLDVEEGQRTQFGVWWCINFK